MNIKEERWYEIEDGTLFVYNSPYKNSATTVVMCQETDLFYYRRHFKLSRVWEQV